jgi:hypothetical protein
VRIYWWWERNGVVERDEMDKMHEVMLYWEGMR